MILVRVRPEDVPAEWSERAGELTRQLLEAVDDPETDPDGRPRRHRNLAPEKRKAIIKANSGIWSELKPIFLQWSFGKCWYSEAREIGSDYHVDHFRPKGRIRIHPDFPHIQQAEDGYWWLAFDWRNYRLSCGICNSPHTSEGGETLGKWDYFPLCTVGTISSPTDDLEEEIPVLLDPTKAADVRLLTFRETGEAIPTVPRGSQAYRRVSTAIRVLNLNSTALREERRRVFAEMRELLDRLDELYERPLGVQGQYFERDVDRILGEIMVKTAPDRELCGAARAAIKMSGNHYAIERLAPLDGSVLSDPRWRLSSMEGIVEAQVGSSEGSGDRAADEGVPEVHVVVNLEESGERAADE